MTAYGEQQSHTRNVSLASQAYSPPFQFHFPSPPSSEKHESQSSISSDFGWTTRRSSVAVKPGFASIYERSETPGVPTRSTSALSGSTEKATRVMQFASTENTPSQLPNNLGRVSSRASSKHHIPARTQRNTFGMLDPSRQMEPFEEAQLPTPAEKQQPTALEPPMPIPLCQPQTSDQSGNLPRVALPSDTFDPLGFSINHISLVPLPPTPKSARPWHSTRSVPSWRSSVGTTIRNDEPGHRAVMLSPEAMVSTRSTTRLFVDQPSLREHHMNSRKVGQMRLRDAERDDGVLQRRSWVCGC